MKLILSTLLAGLILAVALQSGFHAQTSSRKVSYIPYEDARPIIALAGDALPPDVRAAGSQASSWNKWVAARDAEIRVRLTQGDEDSLVNFLLFGSSFTRKPRITLNMLAGLGGILSSNAPAETSPVLKAVSERADDLIQAITVPGANERLLFARQIVESRNQDLKTAAGRERLKQYLLANLARVLNESVSYARVLESARLLGDVSAEFAERSKLYATRGLSSDTSLLPNFALERALTSLKAQGLMATGSVRRVGIIGPGLDFADKQDGYDFYPQQTIQPFAIIDTLLRLGLARANDLQVMTFDLSPRVNAHLRRARTKALRGEDYRIQLPRDAQSQWKPEVIEYWSKFGDQIGLPVAPVALPTGVGDLKLRAVRVRPAIVSLITPEDTNIVLQRMDVAQGQGFDLLIATNILVYYNEFEQALALANVEKMLRPGGFLLSNNAVPELPSSAVHSAGYETVVYSAKPDDGDHIVFYQRAPSK